MVSANTLLLMSFLYFTETLGVPFVERIVNGSDAKPGEAPYQLSVRYENDTHFCGASLTQVGETQLAISAAHCFTTYAGPIYLVAGDLKLSDYSGAEQTRKVDSLIIHPEFGGNNDIALLFFDNPFYLNQNVSTINLPSPQMKEFEGVLIVTGWGRLYYGGPGPDDLQLVILPVVSDEACQRAWNMSDTGGLPVNVICAGTPSGDPSPCNGDSGGPAKSGDNNLLIGVVSFGKECGHPDYPGVFTEVAYFIEWIENQVAIFIESIREGEGQISLN